MIACGLVLAGSGAGSEASLTRGRVSAYRLADGRRRWSTPLVPEGGNGGGVLSPVSVDPARGAVFAGTGAPYVPQPGTSPGTCSVVELALDDGRLRWSDQLHPGDALGRDVNSAPVLTRALFDIRTLDINNFVRIDVTSLVAEAQRLGLRDLQLRFLLDFAATSGLVQLDDGVPGREPLLTVEYR